MLKCAHIMIHKTLRHNASIIRVMNAMNLPDAEILYAVFSKEMQKVFSESAENVNYYEDRVKTINRLGKENDFLFIHCFELTFLEILRIKKSVLKKCIWVCWGHDLYLDYESRGTLRFIKKIAKKILWTPANHRLKNIYGIGIGFKYDAVEVAKRFGNMRIFYLPYGYRDDNFKIFCQRYDKIKAEEKPKDGNEPCRIMVGHSAWSIDNHIDALSHLVKFKDENILISLILSYGDMEYAKTVIDFANSHFPGKTEIISEKKTLEEYMKYINSVDVAVLNQTQQSGVGNINLITAFGKKLFLSKNGILKLAMDLENTDTYSVEDIDNMTFEEFKAPCKNQKYAIRYGKEKYDESLYLAGWENVMKELRYQNDSKK